MWSEGATNEDKILTSHDHFVNQDVVVTLKLDGENTTIYSDGYVHARSLCGRAHASQSWVRGKAAAVAPSLPPGYRICGENVYAKHSISYTSLTSFFYVFSLWEKDVCLSWGDTVMWAAALGLPHVDVLYRGRWDARLIREGCIGKNIYANEQEGYVVRMEDAFDMRAFPTRVAKFVRKDHVKTDQHWKTAPIVPNTLRDWGQG